MLDKRGKFIPPLAEMVRTMRARPPVKAWHSGRRLFRRQVQREYAPVFTARWSGRQWTRLRKHLARTERAA